MKKTIEQLIVGVLGELGLEPAEFVVEHPADLSHGDYSTNVALVLAKKFGKSPRELAEEIKDHLEEKKNGDIEKIEVAGAGFINFHLAPEFFKKSLEEINYLGESFGKNNSLENKKILVEHTDPNPFKEFHIGHLMPNVVGSTVAELLAWNGAEVKQACYQGDVGMHIAMAVWAMRNGNDLLEAYAAGAKAFKDNEEANKEIQEINKKIYDKSDSEINKIYEEGRKESLEYFSRMYERLGSEFDYFFFESEVASKGKKIVEENLGKVFEESDGAVVFKAEKFNDKLHTRVFLNSEGLPTYEAKELGLAPAKYEKYPYDQSIVVTGNEINDYFKVLLEAMRQVFPELADKTVHLSHGMLRLPTGKMSSRTGDVTTADFLIEEVKKRTEGREDVAIGAIKYMILRQSIGSDIVFDIEKSVSTEGDSGVYLQYAHARACSILDKARVSKPNFDRGDEVRPIERMLYRFPELVERAGVEYSPNLIVTYLTELASTFNNFYAHEQVIGSPDEAYKLAIVGAFKNVMKNGLDILAIPSPQKI